MAGEGHMFAMIARLKANKALRQSQKNKYKKYQSLYKLGFDEKLEFKKVSEEELEFLRQKYQAKIRKEEQKQLYKLIGIALLVGAVALLLFS